MINKERLIQTFLELVQIDSVSGEEKEVAQYLQSKLDSLGSVTNIDDYGNLIAAFDGEGEPFMLNCHMDTVEPGRAIKPIIKDDRIESDGSTILGADAKAGLAIILETLTSLKEDNKKHVPIDIILTVEEEIGLIGATKLDYSKVRAKKGIVFDGSKDIQNVTISAPGYTRVDVTITGRAAHAGARPEEGISAIRIASEIISKLELGRVDHETTANIGLIEGGSARNAVPEIAHFRGEIRSRDMKKLDNHTAHFQKIIDSVLEQYPEAKIDLIMHREFNPYLFEENHEMIKLMDKALKVCGLNLVLDHAGGGTDVNIFHKYDIAAVAVGTGGYKAHTKEEYAIISEMVDAAKVCEQLVLVD